MKLEQQVCSLKLAKQLKKLGVKQESYFGWYLTYKKIWRIGDMAEVMNHAKMVGITPAPQWEWDYYSAFTVAELGELLPEWFCQLNNNDIREKNTEANARAKMLIYLIENKIIEL